MSSIGIITFLHNDNFGSSLQAYALQRVLREGGFDAEHIDYRPDTAEKIRNLIRTGNNPGLILDGLRKRSVRKDQKGAERKSKAIPAFYAERMKMSPPCRNGAELKRICARYDTLICGSDQIWNPVWLNPAYFLNFAADTQSKIAYAPSLGISTLPNLKKQRALRKLTKGFDAVSVREDEGAVLLKKITGEDVPVMPDPVCLLSREEWMGIAAGAADKRPYILCYFIGSNPDYWQKVQRLQKETDMEVLVLPVTAESYGSGYQLIDGAGPEAFLGAVSGAEIVCTDSFHALAFSTIFGRRCELQRRYREDDPESKNSRVDHFLREIAAAGPEAMRTRGREWLYEQVRKGNGRQ